MGRAPKQRVRSRARSRASRSAAELQRAWRPKRTKPGDVQYAVTFTVDELMMVEAVFRQQLASSTLLRRLRPGTEKQAAAFDPIFQAVIDRCRSVLVHHTDQHHDDD